MFYNHYADISGFEGACHMELNRTCRLVETTGCPGLWACHLPDLLLCKCAYDEHERKTVSYRYIEGQLCGVEPLHVVQCFVDNEIRIANQMGRAKYVDMLKQKPRRLKCPTTGSQA